MDGSGVEGMMELFADNVATSSEAALTNVAPLMCERGSACETLLLTLHLSSHPLPRSIIVCVRFANICSLL